MNRRGAMLLEMVIAIAVFVAAGIAILSMVRNGVQSVRDNREIQHAADLARSAIAQIESGISTIQELDGQVPAWQDETTAAMFEDSPEELSDWFLEIDADRSGFDGLTLVTVRAHREVSGGASYQIQQLMRLDPAEDLVNPEDETLLASSHAERGGRR